MPGYRRTIALIIAAVVAASLLVVPSASAATCAVQQYGGYSRWIVRNGQTVVADDTMSEAEQLTVLAVSCDALATINTISFYLPVVTVRFTNGGSAWGGWGVDASCNSLVSLSRSTPVSKRVLVLRHEFFHHYTEVGDLVTAAEKDSLFSLAHQQTPNGQIVSNCNQIHRYWPNEDRYAAGAKHWFGDVAWAEDTGENYAVLLGDMFDGKNNGIWGDLNRWGINTFDGRHRFVKRKVQRILGFRGYNP